jgi:predicted DNA-binding transcriptional regulator AlpA
MPSTNLKAQDGNAALVSDAQEIVATTADKPARFINKPEVLHRVGVSYPTLWAWMRRPGSAAFPRSRERGGKAAWLESEAWILSRPVRRLKGDK